VRIDRCQLARELSFGYGERSDFTIHESVHPALRIQSPAGDDTG
jgi:hypothetical protein